MPQLMQNIQDAVEFIRTKTQSKPKIGIILGTGLGGLVREIDKHTVIEYQSIPHFPVSTVESHHGKLIFGKLCNKEIVAMQGRFHMYEGYDLKQVTFPVRVMKFLGVENLIISNAAGALNPSLKKGDVMLITDHINFLGDNPLIGPNDERIGIRFPDMSEPYSNELLNIAYQVADDLKIPVQKGVYVALQGPNLETKAEYRMLRTLGADAVGMSTVPEVIVAIHMNMKVLGISILTDECFPDSLQPATLEMILKVAAEAEPKMTSIIKEVVNRMAI